MELQLSKELLLTLLNSSCLYLMFSSASSWSLSKKLVRDMLLVALIPLLLMGYVMLEASKQELSVNTHRNLQSLAELQAIRLRQLVVDTQSLTAGLARNQAIVSLLSRVSAAAALRENASYELDNIVLTNPTFASAFVLDARGMGVVS